MILEISTDKVDAEVPATSAGILLEIRAKEGETVEVGSVVGVIGSSSDVATAGRSDDATERQSDDAIIEETKPEPVEEIAQAATASVVEVNPQSAIPNPQSSEATEVVMPQMGESITEGTVSKWLKAVGDSIEKDEPLLEISTDKVDAEVPSPSAGKLLEIRVQEGETVEVGAVVALVGAAGVPSSKSQVPSPAIAETPQVIETPKIEEPKEIKVAAASAGNGQPTTDKGQMTLEDLRRTKSSPLVRNIAKEHNIDISRISGSGISGRVTKKDILNFIETGAALRPQDLLVKPESRVESRESRDLSPKFQESPLSTLHSRLSTSDRVEPMSVMRKKIAEHMTF